MFKLLFIENKGKIRDKVHRALDDSGLKLSMVEVNDCPAALGLLAVDTFDCLILDSCSNQKTSKSALEKLTSDKAWPSIPVILFNDPERVDDEEDLTEMGVWQVLYRDRFNAAAFMRAVTQAISWNRMEIKALQADQEIAKVKKNASTPQERRAVGELAADIGHDFNNLLTAVLGTLRMAGQEQMSKDAAEHVKKAIDLVLRGANLTDDLLVFSQKQNPTFRVVEPNDLIKGLETRARKILPETVGYKVRLSVKRLRILVDPLEFENTLLRLIQNSSEAINDYGHINITIGEAQVDGSLPGEEDFKPGHYVKITVQDSGAGMSAAIKKRAFDPKFTTKKNVSGAGLGLSNVASYMKQVDGFIKLESEVDQGTTVSLYFPPSQRTEDRQAYSEKAEGALDMTGKGQTILLVEDDISLLNVVTQALRAKNYKVLAAEDAEEAFELILTEKKIDMLITDVFLPDNMTGKDVAYKFHHYFPDCGIIYCSGYHEDVVRKKIALGEEGEVISKPYEISTLLIKMTRMFNPKS